MSEMIERVKASEEYMAVKLYYEDSTAKRSGVPLINHIDEGLRILEASGGEDAVMKAWCLHPMFQDDPQLIARMDDDEIECFDRRSLLLVMEYRNQANQWLSDKVAAISKDPRVLTTQGHPSYGPLPEVKLMLIADKVQNYKDFLAYHKDYHPRKSALNMYFLRWLQVLGVTVEEYNRLCDIAKEGANED